MLKRYVYTFDPAGNRTSEQIDDTVTGASFNSLNRLVSQQASGTLRFVGTVNESATVTIQGKPATVTTTNSFSGNASVTTGTNTVTVSATDPSGNTRNNQYQVESSGPSKTYSYDANGNLTSDGTSNFEWDARNQLVAISKGTNRSEFTYDGLQRRARVVEKMDGVVQTDTRILWCESAVCEERLAAGTVTRRVFDLGEQAGGLARFFATDHLSTISEVVNASGSLLSRFTFDPWGRHEVTAGPNVSTVGFAAQDTHFVSGLYLTRYRAYNSEIGRWLSEDPVAFHAGMNFYRYVDNSPMGFIDPDGLMKACCRPVKGLSSKCHCWIVLSDNQTLGSYRFGIYLQKIYNHTDDRPTPPGSTCYDVPGNEKCVRNEFAKEPDQTFYGPTNTSNSGVSRALKKVGYELPTCAMGRK